MKKLIVERNLYMKNSRVHHILPIEWLVALKSLGETEHVIPAPERLNFVHTDKNKNREDLKCQ